jgi:Xaa-Pro dipeptidase
MLMPIDYNARLDALRAQLGEAHAVALVPGSNMRYFTGLDFHLGQRPTLALITRDGFGMIVPKLEAQKVTDRLDLNAQAFVWSDGDGYLGAFTAALDTLGLRGGVLGMDGMTMRVTEWLAFQTLDPTLRPARLERALIAIRARKTPDELDAMRRAIAISERALARLMDEIAPGQTEVQIAARLTALMSEEGAPGVAFDTTVQVGANTAYPHGIMGDRPLERGQFLIIDFGARVDGYPADITRTFCLGAATPEMERIYNTVLSANIAAKAAAYPGARMGDVDKAARDIIAAAGYGEYFIHRTGHGLGLDMHEPIPQIAAGVEETLDVDMVFTIEPGIYLPGVGGVRIEDDVVVTARGIDVLTSYPRQLVVAR